MKLTNPSFAARSRGFTLVEMAVVLAIIGLILGALAIAKDVQRNAEYNRVANKFVMQWRAAYDQYFQRTGSVVGDCQQAPTYMVNGAETDFDGSGGDVCQRTSPWAGGSGAAGVPANFTNTGLRICNGEGYPANSVGPGDPEMAEQNLRDLVLRSGITLPAGRGEGFEDRYVYEDANGNVAELQVCFQWNPPEQASGSGNVMVIRGLTPDLARYLDQLIDGQADAREGRFRIQNDGQRSDEPGGANQPGNQWAANVTHSQNHFQVNPEEPANAIAIGRAFNEDEVVLLTAHWRMDQ